MVDYSIIPSIIAIVWPLRNAIIQRHFVLRSSAIESGLTLIFLGISLLVLNVEYSFSVIPLPLIPLFVGALIILLTTVRNPLGTMLGHGWVTVGISVFVLLVQLGLI